MEVVGVRHGLEAATGPGRWAVVSLWKGAAHLSAAEGIYPDKREAVTHL